MTKTFMRIVGWTLLLSAGLAGGEARGMGGQLGMEFAIDAPWRLEPIVAGPLLEYTAIPITVTFQDAIFDTHRGIAAGQALPRINVGTFRHVEVEEIWGPAPTEWTLQRWAPVDLREIERKARLSTVHVEPTHQLCHPTPADSCQALLDVGNSHEWHALLWYQPTHPVTPGRNIHLKVSAVTVHDGIEKRFTNSLVVHAGEAPLPRFSRQWLYGDLHYHAQGTDNEGETGYAYRNVVRALAALGLDFAFATDHASGGEQVDGELGVGPWTATEARDLNAKRFAWAKATLYGPGGANDVIAHELDRGNLATWRGRQVLPQLFMAEELDVIPEMSRSEFDSGLIRWGDDMRYPWSKLGACAGDPKLPFCRHQYSVPHPYDSEGYLVKDLQAVLFTHLARQHLIYLPHDATATGAGWIPGDTGEFGGASRLLADVLSHVQGNGFTFLAHPTHDQAPGDDRGPDVIPYSERSLEQAWSSPACLGLQFWNENRRLFTDVRDGESPMFTSPANFIYLLPFRLPFPWTWRHWNDPAIAGNTSHWDSLYHGAHTWDVWLRRGLDPARTAPLPFVAPNEPRKWFMAGGSDAHGDWNFRREGRPQLVKQWTDAPASDTALGKPRNLVLAGEPLGGGPPAWPTARRHTQAQVAGALAAGRFGVTDGPALRLLVDRNRNGEPDDGDFQMGDTFHLFPGERVPLILQWVSTPEFGPVDHLDVYLGRPDLTFAPTAHGPPRTPGTAGKVSYAGDGGRLRVTVTGRSGMRGHALVYVNPGEFGLTVPDRLFYLRAFAQTAPPASACSSHAAMTSPDGRCLARFAYSNPIWGQYKAACTRDARAIDGDADGLADVCDPCPDVGELIEPVPLAARRGGHPPLCGQVRVDRCPSGPTCHVVVEPQVPYRPDTGLAPAGMKD